MSDLHHYDLTTSTWTQLPSSSAISGRGGAEFIALGRDKLLVLGGFSGKENSDVHAYDIAAQTWQQLASTTEAACSLTPRSVFTAAHVAAEHAVIVYGGEVDPSDKGHAGQYTYIPAIADHCRTLIRSTSVDMVS